MLFIHYVFVGLWLCAQIPATQPASIPTLADTAELFTAQADKSQISYTLKHQLHLIKATAAQGIVGKAKVIGKRTIQVIMDASVMFFDSHNANRDQHMKEVVQAALYEHVILKAQAILESPMAANNQAHFKGQLQFHGITRPIEFDARIDMKTEMDAHVLSDFSISLDAYQIERPSLLFIKVDDKLDIHADVVFKRQN